MRKQILFMTALIAATGLWSSPQAHQPTHAPEHPENSEERAQETQDALSPPITLDPLTIRALRSSLFEASSQLQTTVIDSDELSRNRWQNLGDALNAQSGIIFSQAGGPGQQASLFMRGLDNKHTLLLVDGFVLNDPSEIGSGVIWNHLHLGSTHQVEIVRGPQSNLWGSGAAGGVISLSTQPIVQEGTHGQAYASLGSFYSERSGVDLSHKQGGLILEAGFHQSEAEGFSAAAPKKGSDDYGKKPESVGFGPDGHRMESHRIRLAYTLPSGVTLTARELKLSGWSQFDGGAGVDANHTQRSETLLRGVEASQHLTGGRWQIFAHRSSFDRKMTTTGAFAGTGTYDAESSRSGFDGELNYHPGMTLFIAAEQNREHLGRSYSTDLDRTHSSQSLLIAHGARFLEDRGLLSVGVRHNRHSDFADKNTFQASLNWQEREWLLFAGQSTAYKAPSLYQLYDPFSGNDALDPETIQATEVGFGWADRLKVTLFQNRITDLIDGVCMDPPNCWSWGTENLSGTSTIQGAEMSFAQSWAGGALGFSLHHTHLFKAEDTNGDRLARRPKDQSAAHLDYLPIEALSLRLSGEYIGDRIDQKNTKTQTGNYTLAHLAANWRLSEQATLFGRIENLTDRYYQVVDGYQSAPRSAYVGLEARF